MIPGGERPPEPDTPPNVTVTERRRGWGVRRVSLDYADIDGLSLQDGESLDRLDDGHSLGLTTRAVGVSDALTELVKDGISDEVAGCAVVRADRVAGDVVAGGGLDPQVRAVLSSFWMISSRSRYKA